jgi:DNA-binding SARP family transcriptional activator
MAAELHIALLGPLAVTLHGETLPDGAWRSRQERRLLGILLTARGTRVSTERLLDWLWPGADPAAAATTLRSTISGLRHTLEPAGGARASSRYILTRPGGYAWNSASGAWVDLEAFLALTGVRPKVEGSSAAPPPSSMPAPLSSRLERAIALYRGGYLADEPDAPWADDVREMLRERFLAALHELAELRLAAGELAVASDLARRGLEHDRMREPLYRTLMRAQAEAGDVAGALQTYERCRRALDEELGAAPAPQTRALHTAILQGDMLAGQRPTTDDRRSTMDEPIRSSAIIRRPSFPLHPLTRSPGHAPFVGRAAELAALREWIAALDDRRGGIVAIVGEAGIGKTRLVAEALREAGGGAVTIILRCTALERGLPFAALSEALRPLLRAAPIELLGRLPPAALAQVAELLPVVRERLPQLPALPAAPPAEGRNYLLDGLVDLAVALSREQALIIWCDDAQWADEATLATLGRLARRAPRHALLIFLAYRAEELVENAALHELLRALGRDMSLRPLILGRLDDGEVTQLLSALTQAPGQDSAALAARLGASAGGNPLFLSVAAQALLEARATAPQPDAAAPMPDLAGAPPLRDLVLARVDRLPEHARVLLEQLAVIGRAASLDLIEQLVGEPALDAARMLLERRLLVEEADGRLDFGHELVRSIVARSLSSPQRRALHRRAAEAVAALHGTRPERAAELAFHFEQVGRGAEAEVLRYALAAGDAARRSFGYRAAREHYDTALRAGERMAERAPAELVRRAFAGQLLMHEALLDWEGVTATAERYERWAATQPDQPPLVTLRRLVVLRALMGDLAGAAALSGEQARRRTGAPAAIDDMLRRTAIILRPADPLVAAGDWRLWSTHLLIANRQSPIVFTPDEPPPGSPADDLPTALGAEEATLPLFQIGWALLTQGHVRGAEPCLLRSYSLAVETSQAAVAVVSALQLAYLSDLCGDGAAAGRWMDTSLDTAQRAPEAAWASIWPRIHQAFSLLLDDQHAAARDEFMHVADDLRGLTAFQSHRSSVAAGLGLLDLAAGDLGRAGERLRGALAAPPALYGFVYVAAQLGLARIAALGRDLGTARALLGHALHYSATRGLLPEYARTALEIARIERDFGAPAPALPLLREAATLAGTGGLAPLAAAARALEERLHDWNE